ncbi:RDD family protein [Spongiivirga sp. MCCC 1A20706]|uniref:RDD family protein n=1 Tax=Spongiivirga sp. MCCC 1A20706 TaxID=3160963 RepID=UPI003977A4C8
MSELQVNTTQNVNLNFTAATVGHRILAFIIDFLIIAAYCFVSLYILYEVLGFNSWTRDWDGWSKSSVVTIVLLPAIFHTLLFEMLLEGQTVGKRIMKIKVIKIDGYQAGFADYIVRWMFRTVEIYLGSGIIGMMAIVLNSKNRRLGDIAAGTAVINLKTNINISHTILEEIHEQYQPMFPSVIRLSDRDATIIKDSYLIAKKNNDLTTIIKLRKKIEEVIDVKNTLSSDYHFIDTILKDYNFYTQKM